MRYLIIKRIIDLLVCFLIFPFSVSIILIFAIPNFFILKKNPFFFQKRSGVHGRAIKILKLKTMIDDPKLNNHERLYNYGNFLRKYKIDELPQIFNVFYGTMTLVGPRPLFIEYNKKYNSFESQRLNVKPGITGLAQVRLKNSGNWRAKIKYDIWYINNKSISFDLKILILTVVLIFKIIFLKKELIEDHKLKS